MSEVTTKLKLGCGVGVNVNVGSGFLVGVRLGLNVIVGDVVLVDEGVTAGAFSSIWRVQALSKSTRALIIKANFFMRLL
jgi:UDP-3-O-[3-hydroxymyristoyl] glucosamine N-acyltransferase